MSHLLAVMEPFRKNMNKFITVYEKVNDILQRITTGFGYAITQEEYFIAAAQAGLSPLQAEELLKQDFVNISRKLTEENEEGSIPSMLHIMDDERQFTFSTRDVGDATNYSILQIDFKRGIRSLRDDLGFFLENVDDPESGVFNAPGDVIPDSVTTAINNYKNFITFLKQVASRENLENNARGRRKSRRLKKSKRGKKSKKNPKSKKHPKAKKSRKTKKKK